MQAAIQQRVSMRSAFVASAVAPVRRVALAPVKLTTVQVEAGGKASKAGKKLKTRKAAAKRFKVTGSGKLMARKAGKQHFNEKKSSEDLMDLNKMFVLSKTDVWNATKCLPNSGIGGK